MKLSSDITAIVTGGASGLGEATARGLAAKGVKVGIFDMNEDRGAKVAADFEAQRKLPNRLMSKTRL